MDTKRRLVGVTASLLRERGYHAAGLAQILATSGLPKGSLYHHFPNGKPQLAAESIQVTGAAIAVHLRRLAQAADSVAAAVAKFCDDYAAGLEQTGFRHGCPLATVALESAVVDQSVQAAVGDAFAAMLAVLTEGLIAEQVAADVAGDLAIEIVSSVEGALVLAKATRNTRALGLIRDRLVTRINDAVVAGAARPASPPLVKGPR